MVNLTPFQSEFEYSISYVLAGLIEKHFKEDYKIREAEEKDVQIILAETKPPTPIVPRTQERTQQEDTTRRRNSGWWRDCVSQSCILLYPCDM